MIILRDGFSFEGWEAEMILVYYRFDVRFGEEIDRNTGEKILFIDGREFVIDLWKNDRDLIDVGICFPGPA